LKKNKISKSWLYKNKKDIFIKKSKIEGYRSRSAYKLIEMNEKFKFIKKKTLILDLGSSPGGWSQVATEGATEGKILAVDIKPMLEIKNVFFINGNFEDPKIYEKITTHFNGKIDLVMSDMALNTTGNKNLDSNNTGELCLRAMELAKKTLQIDGVFLSKLFMGQIFSEIQKKAKKTFKKVIQYKPLASKKESKEIYIYCKGLIKI